MSNESKYHVKRHDDREVFDRDAVNALLDSEYVAHVGFVDAEINEPFVIPMAYARDNDRILLHGSTGSRLMMQLAKGAQLISGMVGYDRPTAAKEAAGTMIIELPIEKYSLKSRTGGVMDEPEDAPLPIWSGVLPTKKLSSIEMF